MKQAEQIERRRQVRGLVWLGLAALGFAVARAAHHAGVRGVFPPGWWRAW